MFANAPCCDDCWWNVDETNTPTPNGRGLSQPEEGNEWPLRFPVRIINQYRSLERCHFCGFETYSGIYIRTNVNETPAAAAQERREME